MPERELTVEEVKAKLREAGLPVDGWATTEERTVVSPLIQRQADLLLKAKDLLEMQLEQDLKTVAELHEQVARLEHGGGR